MAAISERTVAMDQKPLVFEDFADKVGETFSIAEEGLPEIPLSLREALPLQNYLRLARPPFSLTFVGSNPVILPQRLYRLAHKSLGKVSIFLVPVGRDAQGVNYQATFN